jgi:BASS family bile acid:Na+ symporter
MQTLIELSTPPLTLLLLAAVGLDLTMEDFARVRRQRTLVLAGLIGPILLLPPIALVLTQAFRSSPEVAGALLLVAACPIGGISNTYTYLARASPALSVALTGLSCLLAPLTIPLVGRGLAMASGQPLDVAPPFVLLLVQLVLMLVVPVSFGMWVRQRWSSAAIRWRPVIQNLTFAGVAMMLALIVLDNPAAFVGDLPQTVPLAAAFVVCSFAAGWVTASAVTADHRDCFTLATEFGTRNLGVALGIAVALLGRVEFARFAYTYFLTELLMMLPAILVFRRWPARIDRAPGAADSVPM